MADVARASSAGGGVLGRVVVYGLLALVAVYYLLPLFVMLSTSVKSLDEIRTGNLLALPTHIGFEAWAKAWGTDCATSDCRGLSRNFWNSMSFVLPAVVIATLVGAFNGYVLALWRFRGSDLLFTSLLVGCLYL